MPKFLQQPLILRPKQMAHRENIMKFDFEVKCEKRLVIITGLIIEVALIKLVKAPCNSPCSFAGTWPVIIDWSAGPEIPPRQYGIKKINIIHPCVAQANNTNPNAYMPNPI